MSVTINGVVWPNPVYLDGPDLRSVPGLSDIYQIDRDGQLSYTQSDAGRIAQLLQSKSLRPKRYKTQGAEWLAVTLPDHDPPNVLRLAVAVLLAFIGPKPPPGAAVWDSEDILLYPPYCYLPGHKDDDYTNCKAENLYWRKYWCNLYENFDWAKGCTLLYE